MSAIMAERPVHEHIRELSDSLVALSGTVLRNFLLAIDVLQSLDTDRAREVKDADRQIDDAEILLESQCLSFLALQQPVAKDLRTIVAIMKINDYLERIGDLSVHVVERLPEIGSGLQRTYDFGSMGMKVGEMLKKAVDAFAFRDDGLARQIDMFEAEIDLMHRVIFKKAMASMKEPAADIDQLIAVLSLSRYLERIADHAVKIAREVVYLVTGESARQKDNSYEKLIDSLRN
jgi:phosphate transport system protein